jgi:di/tricarboxylate transporter
MRDGKRRFGTGRNLLLKAGDILVLEAVPEALDEFRTALKLDFAPEGHPIEDAVGDGVSLIEMVVTDASRIAGRTAQAIGLGWRKRTVLMGISRKGQRMTKRLRQTVIEPGDILLLLTPSDTGEDVVDWLGGLALADRGLSVTRDSKTWAAIGFFAGAVIAASLGLVYLPIALGLVVVAYVLFRILPLAEIYDHIEWPVVVLLGSMIPLGAALEASGGTELLAQGLVSISAGWPAWGTLTLLMVVTMTLSDVLNNTATAIVAAPVGIRMAETLEVNPDPFLMAVAVAASAAFLTPIGHKNNTLVLGPGGYGFGDYWRMGLPLEIIVIGVSIPTILLVWPL